MINITIAPRISVIKLDKNHSILFKVKYKVSSVNNCLYLRSVHIIKMPPKLATLNSIKKRNEEVENDSDESPNDPANFFVGMCTSSRDGSLLCSVLDLIRLFFSCRRWSECNWWP